MDFLVLVKVTFDDQVSPSSPRKQRNSSDDMALLISPVSAMRFRTNGPGVFRLPDRRASLTTIVSSAFLRIVGAIALNSIVSSQGLLRSSGPSNRCAVKLSAAAVLVDSRVSDITSTIGVGVPCKTGGDARYCEIADRNYCKTGDVREKVLGNSSIKSSCRPSAVRASSADCSP